MDWPRSSDRIGVGGADRGGRMLCAGWVEQVWLEPVCAPRGDCVPGTELAGGLARWNAGTGAATIASALRLLCRSHGRQLRRSGVDGWSFLVRNHAALDRNRTSDCILAAVNPILSGDARARRVSTVLLALRADRTAHPAGSRQSGAVVETASAS